MSLKTRYNNQENWQKKVIVLWVGTFLTGIGMSSVLPFLPLYIQTLGSFSKAEVNLYTSLAFSATFLVSAVVSPIWGRLADRYGRKPMLIRAASGMAVVMFLMAFVTDAWQIVALRFILGGFNGYIANANALVANQTPSKQVGRALGIIATGFTAGSLIGPLFGGVTASIFGYRTSFIITALFLSLVVLLTIFLVDEKKPEQNKEIATDNFSTVWSQIDNGKLLVGIFFTSMFIQTALNSINPIMSLFVKELTNNSAQTALLAGFVAAAPGITTILFAPRFGNIGEKIGTEKLAMIGFLIGAIAIIPSAFATNVWMLFGFRLLAGVANAAMNPVIQTLLAKKTQKKFINRVFSFNQSFQAMGNFFGPLLGGLVASQYGYRAVFIVSGILLIFNLFYFRFFTKKAAN